METDEEELPPSAGPIFRIVDGGVDRMYVRSCVSEPGMVFLSGFPKIGSCMMCGLKRAEDDLCPAAVLVCDTLSPPVTGSPISKVKTNEE
mgnify:CR=1 FL=1